MLNLDQIKQLETKVSKAIQLIQSLKEENDSLKLEVHDRQKKIDELENIVLVFKNDQAKIEEGIINALNHLSAFEDTVYQAANTSASLSAEQQAENHQPADAAECERTAAEKEKQSSDVSVKKTDDQKTEDIQAASDNAEQMEIF